MSLEMDSSFYVFDFTNCRLLTYQNTLSKIKFNYKHFQILLILCQLRASGIFKVSVEGQRVLAWLRLHVIRLSCLIIFRWLLTEITAPDSAILHYYACI